MAPDTGGGNQSQYKKQISHTTKITAFSYRGINKRIKNVKHANHKPRSEIAIVFEASCPIDQVRLNSIFYTI